jgi:hypothetical protein
MTDERKRSFIIAWCLAFVVFSTIWCWLTAWSIGPTFDEPTYVFGGLANLRLFTHKNLLDLGTMPLPPEVQTLPLMLLQWIFRVRVVDAPTEWLPIARMTSIVFWWLLLWASYRLATIYGGPLAGCLAVALIACEPVLLGHASLATTDLPFAACLTQMLAVFRGRRDRVDWKSRLLAPACWVGLTFLAKASALVFVPICLVAVEAERLLSNGWRPNRAGWQSLRASALDLLAVGAMGLAFMIVFCPFAWDGIAYQIRHNGTNTASHLFGEYSPTGFRHYFVAALAIKFGLPVLILLAAMLILRPQGLANGALVAGLCLLAATPLFRVQLGVRFVLAIGILMTIGAAVAFARWHDRGGKVRRYAAMVFAGLLVVVAFANALAVWPNGICYVNPLFGGTRDGFRVLSESNCDWGQGLPELARWQTGHDDAPLSLWYFGQDPAVRASRFRSVTLEEAKSLEQIKAEVAGTYLAASTTYLFTVGATTSASKWLRTIEPYDQTSTYLIYDFRNLEAGPPSNDKQ